MITRDMMLAAFIAFHGIPVRKTNPDGDMEYEFDLEADAPLVLQYKDPNGYNCNIHRLVKKLEENELAPYYIAPSK